MTTGESTAGAGTAAVGAAPRAAPAPPEAGADCRRPSAVLVADPDGDGCLDALRYADGVLEAGGIRWQVGAAGDTIATGDWSCQGTRTVALLRPSTGEVFRFDGWAVGEVASVAAPRVGVFEGATALRVADVDADGCHELVVERGHLPPQVLPSPSEDG